MTTAAQFQHRLDELKLDTLQDTGQEGITSLQSEMRQILEDVNREMQVIRGQYSARISAANAGGSSRIQVSNRQAASERHRVEEVERLENERDQKIQPYQDVKEKIEALLAQVDEKASGTEV